MLEIVPEAICCCYHGDGSEGRHVCTKYHIVLSATYRLLCWFYSLRLFVVGGGRIAMVVGHISTQNIIVIHNIIY